MAAGLSHPQDSGASPDPSPRENRVRGTRGGWGPTIDERLRQLSAELTALERRAYGRGREQLAASGEAEAVQSRIQELRRELREAWPVRGVGREELGVDRKISFLETAPRHSSSIEQERAYWRDLEDAELDDDASDRLRRVLIELVARGFSTALDLAVPVAARLWNPSMAGAVAALQAPASDPALRSAVSRFSVRVRRRREGVDPEPLPPAPGSPHPRMIAAAERLRATVDRHVIDEERAQWAFGPPATDAQIDELRALIDPFPLPASLETWLRYANGFGDLEFWPGFVMGIGYSIERVSDSWDRSHDYPDMRPGLAALGYASHSWAALELVGHREPAVIDVTFGSSRVVAPSLPAFFEATADCIEAGFFDRWRQAGPWRDDPIRREFQRIWDERCVRAGWDDAPAGPNTWLDSLAFPPEWTTPVAGRG